MIYNALTLLLNEFEICSDTFEYVRKRSNTFQLLILIIPVSTSQGSAPSRYLHSFHTSRDYLDVITMLEKPLLTKESLASVPKLSLSKQRLVSGYHFSITCWQYCRFSRQHRCFDNHSYTMLISYKRMLKSVNYDRYSSPCTSQSHSRISSRLYKMISIPIFSKPDAPAKLSKSFLGLAPISHSA